jgi:pseudouridine-5'-monophosphatase
MGLASSAGRKLFDVKTSHIPGIASAFPESCRVFGDDADMGDAKKKPCPDIFLLALDRINVACEERREEKVKPEECLVFEDSIAGVEAGRRAGMRVVWVPHEGLAEVCKGREIKVLEGRTEINGVPMDLLNKVGEVSSAENERFRTEDARAEMLRTLENFPYDEYRICVIEENV